MPNFERISHGLVVALLRTSNFVMAFSQGVTAPVRTHVGWYGILYGVRPIDFFELCHEWAYWMP